MDDTGLDAWLVANLPHIAPWAGLALFVVWAVTSIIYHATRGAEEYARGYRAGERIMAALDADDCV